MKRQSKSVLPDSVTGFRCRLEEWRKSRTTLGPMPEALWNEAVELAARHGVAPISRDFHLDYSRLKRRLEAIRTRPGVNRPVPDEDPPPKYPGASQVGQHTLARNATGSLKPRRQASSAPASTPRMTVKSRRDASRGPVPAHPPTAARELRFQSRTDTP